MRLRILLALALIFGLGATARAQSSPYSNVIFKAQTFTATGQTGTPIQLNGLVVASTVGSSFASGTITVTGSSLTTVTFGLQGSSDGGATYYALPVSTVASPTTAPTMTITATGNGLYQVNLAGLTHVRFVTSGTFTATNVSLTLTASPNASLSKSNGSGGGTPTGAAGGALSGTYPNPGIATVNSGSGICGDSTHVCQVTTNPAGQTTSQASVAIASSGGGTSNPNTCTANASNIACLALAPYYDSGAGAYTGSNSGTTSPGTTVLLASTCLAAKFDSVSAGAQYGHQGIYIPGAGASGAGYIGTVSTCVGSTITLASATSTSVASGTTIYHDETAAVQAAVTAMAPVSGIIYLPCPSVTRINGTLQDTGGANSAIVMPHYTISQSTVTKVVGCGTPTTFTANGTIIQTDGTSGALWGGYCSTCGQNNFTFAGLEFDNVTFRAPDNPSVIMVDARWIATYREYHSRFDTGPTGAGNLPTNTTGAGLLLPYQGNDVSLDVTDFIAAGFGICLQTGEHLTITSGATANCIKSYVPESRPGAPYAGNFAHILHAWDQSSTYVVSEGVNVAALKIDVLDLEDTRGFGINSPTGKIFGDIGFNVQTPSHAVTPTNPAVNGAANLCIHNVQFPNGVTYGGACPASIANATITVGSGVSFAANTCSSYTGTANTASTTTITGLTSAMTVNHTPTSDVKGVTGWGPGSGGQLYFQPWPSAGSLSDYVCNPTSSAIVTGSSTTWNVSAK